MPRTDDFRPTPGFQGSETTGVEVTIYPQGDDPIVFNSDPMSFQGRTNRDSAPSLVAVNTSKTMGAASGSWNAMLKSGRSDIENNIFNSIVDDDWVDIVFRRHGRRWHVMRGLVDNLRRTKTVSSSGATSTVFNLSGRDYTKIWEQTPIWFNPYTDENVSGAVSSRVFGGAENILGNPAQAVVGFLRGFLEELSGVGRANWVPPSQVPNITNQSFIESVLFDTDGYPNDPALIGLSQNYLMPQGTLWALAKEWSDPLFNELYSDIFLQSGGVAFAGVQQADEWPVDQTQMTVVFRKRPFPTLEDGSNSPYFALPVFIVPREAIASSDLGRGGAERYNAFFVAPQLTQEVLAQSAIDVLQPEWAPDDILKHGLRRFDVASKYSAADADLASLSKRQRLWIRDWYMMNPYLLNGSVSLGIGMPNIRIGTRIRIPGARSQNEDETYYVEQVSHGWRFGAGTRTNLGLTRGWVGTNDSYLEAMQRVAAGYIEAKRAQPEVAGTT